jgi:hypothetical protein
MTKHTDDLNESVKDAMKSMMDQMEKETWTNICGERAVSYEPLTIERLTEMSNKFNRDMRNVYVIASNGIPDDAYGILLVRPEDAEKWGRE